LIIGLDNTVLNVALPTLQGEFSATSSQLQWMVDSYVVVFAGLLLTLGALGDRLGRGKALQAGLVIFGGSSLWAAYAGSADALIAARAVMGIGGALIMPATLSILTDVFPREERGRAIAIWSGVAGIGIGLGPLVAGLLLEWFWWGSVFLINVPIAVIALAAGLWLVPDSRDPEHTALDIPGALLSISAISLLVYAIIEAPNHGWLAGDTLLAFAGAIVLAAAFFWWELRTAHPMLDMSFFRNRRFSMGSSAIGLTFFALFGTVFAFTQYLQFVHGYTALEAGVRLIPLALGIMIGAGRSHVLVEKLGTTKVVAAGMTAVAIALGSLALWGVETPYWIMGVTIFLLSLGMGNVMAPATDAVMGAVPEAKAGVGSAMNDVVRQVAGAFGVAIIGSIMNTVYSDRMADASATLPAEAAGPARDSVGAALAIAVRLDGAMGNALASAARAAFVDAMGIAALTGAAVALAGAVMVLRWLPARHEG
ncbi:MAG: DHA2 family efflux MFS transporter permease subunit, partial [Thermomicrobiales bacterium]|nr:DHA2 family efflux MFS transporter permease subunit [Thermomicrobiales bacterium]